MIMLNKTSIYALQVLINSQYACNMHANNKLIVRIGP